LPKKSKKPVVYPPNVFASKGRLYFQKVYQGQRYVAPLNGLKDTHGGRQMAARLPEVQLIIANMKAGIFNPNNFSLLKNYHTQGDIEGIPIFADYADKWLEMKKAHVAPSTYRTYRDLIINLKLFFWDYTLDKIDRELVEEWLAKKKPEDGKGGFANLNDQLRRLKSIMMDATEDYDKVEYKLRRVTSLKSYAVDDPETGNNAFFTIEELDKLYWKAKERMRCMMLTSFFASLRPGELAALKREQINFGEGTLRVISTLSDNGMIKEPKTKAGYRTIEMHPVLLLHLRNYLNTHNHEFVFVSERGNPFTRRQSWEREFKLLKVTAGVRDLRWYGLRKAFATYRFACSDAVPATIASEMGHADVSMTLNTYSQKVKHLGIKWESLEFPLMRPIGPNVVEFSGKGKG
jgi:integrase